MSAFSIAQRKIIICSQPSEFAKLAKTWGVTLRAIKHQRASETIELYEETLMPMVIAEYAKANADEALIPVLANKYALPKEWIPRWYKNHMQEPPMKAVSKATRNLMSAFGTNFDEVCLKSGYRPNAIRKRMDSGSLTVPVILQLCKNSGRQLTISEIEK